MKTHTILAIVSVMGLLGGCSTTPQAEFQLAQRYVTVITDPPGATVTQLRPLGQVPVELGITPLVNRPVRVITGIKMENMPFAQGQEILDHENNLVVLIEKAGYKSHRATFLTKPDETTEHSITLSPISKGG